MRKSQQKRRQMTPLDIAVMSAEAVVFFGQVGLSIFLYDSLRLSWLSYLGWALLLAAVLLAWQARVEFEKKGKERKGGSWLRTRGIVDSGVYSVFRHPMYFSFAMLSLSLVCLSQHWLNALLGAIMIGLLYSDMLREESSSVKRFGEEYRRYMKRVPRANLVLGIVRRIARKRDSEAS